MDINDNSNAEQNHDQGCNRKYLSRKILHPMIFDVEITRMKKYKVPNKTQELILKKPLNRWIHADGSKLFMKDSIKSLAN
jgi:hypothetical protein